MHKNRVNVLLLSWRDIRHPKMGGAEIFTHEMMKNSDRDKYNFVHMSPMFKGAVEHEEIDEITYIRRGTLKTLILECLKYYRRNKANIDIVVDQCNTFRFFTKFWVEYRKRVFFIHQLTREIWDIELKFPFNKIGKMLETPILKLNKHDKTITVSESTKRDLIDVGFCEKNIDIIPEGLDLKPWTVSEFCKKEDAPTFIYVGRFAKYKGIDTCFSAFGKIKNEYPNAKLWIVGKQNESYIKNSLTPICRDFGLSAGTETEGCDITYFGFVSEEKKLELMSRAHLLLMPSIREGWGLIITEAAVVGTPSVVFNSPGIIDAVDFGSAGYISQSKDAKGLAQTIELAICNVDEYEKMREAAHSFSSKFNWKATGEAFTAFLGRLEN